MSPARDFVVEAVDHSVDHTVEDSEVPASAWALHLHPADPDRDLDDAARVVLALKGIDELREVVHESWANRASREAVKAIWEKPRLGRSDDSDLLWSETAATARLGGTPRRSGVFVVEHVVPAREIMARLLTALKHPADPVYEVLDVLQHWSILAVLHRDEPLARETNARFQYRMPTSAELASITIPDGFPQQWLRYLLVDEHFRPEQLKPLDAWRT